MTKKEKKSQKLYPTDYNLLIAQNSWQAHYQIMFLILLKELTKLNVNMEMTVQNVKPEELNKRLWNTQALKMI